MKKDGLHVHIRQIHNIYISLDFEIHVQKLTFAFDLLTGYAHCTDKYSFKLSKHEGY